MLELNMTMPNNDQRCLKIESTAVLIETSSSHLSRSEGWMVILLVKDSASEGHLPARSRIIFLSWKCVNCQTQITWVFKTLNVFKVSNHWISSQWLLAGSSGTLWFWQGHYQPSDVWPLEKAFVLHTKHTHPSVARPKLMKKNEKIIKTEEEKNTSGSVTSPPSELKTHERLRAGHCVSLMHSSSTSNHWMELAF